MTDTPEWFSQLKWSTPGFTVGNIPLSPNRVLYIGEAAGQSLRARLSTYLVDYRQPRASGTGAKPSKGHKGKGFILEMRDKVTDHGVYVSWVEYGASEEDIHILEASLINYLNPDANDRIEEHRHELLGDDELLDHRLIL